MKMKRNVKLRSPRSHAGLPKEKLSTVFSCLITYTYEATFVKVKKKEPI